MAFAYYYTPCFIGERPDPDTGEPDGSPVKEPGMDPGEGTEPVPFMPSGVGILKWDDPLTRCVVRVPFHTSVYPGWVPKTSGEVLADYPGLNGVI
jgi:hypothetical protein